MILLIRTKIERRIKCESNKSSILSPCSSLTLDISQTIHKMWIKRDYDEILKPERLVKKKKKKTVFQYWLIDWNICTLSFFIPLRRTNCNYLGVWSNGLGWCTRYAKCEIQCSSPNMNLVELPSSATQGLLVSLKGLESYGSPLSPCT